MTGIASYDRLLKLGRSRAHPIMLDVGSCRAHIVLIVADELTEDCICSGNRSSQAHRRRVSARQRHCNGHCTRCVSLSVHIIDANMLRECAEFWELGQKLFNTTNETFPVPFVPGDLFDPSFLDPAPPAYAPSAMSTPKLSAVRTLTELRGHVSAMTVCAVFHVFRTADMQLQLARALGSLLSPEPGSMIVGRHNGLPQKGFWRDRAFLDMFCHSPESWEEMWDGVVFEKGTVKVEALLVEKHSRMMLPDGAVGQKPIFILEWSVTRV